MSTAFLLGASSARPGGREPSGKLELVLIEIRNRDVFQRDRIRRACRDHRIRPDLLRRSDEMRSVGEDRAVDLHSIAAVETRNLILAEIRFENEYLRRARIVDGVVAGSEHNFVTTSGER